MPAWERSYASCSGVGISVPVRSHPSTGAGGGRCLESGGPGAHPGHVVIIKSLPGQQCLRALSQKLPGCRGLCPSWLWPVPDVWEEQGTRSCLEGAGPACVAPSWGLGIPEGRVVAVACALAPQLVEAPSRCPLLCQATLSCPQLSQGHSVTWVMLSGFTSCWGSGACWAPPAPLWPHCWGTGISGRDQGWPQPPSSAPLSYDAARHSQPLAAPSEAAGPC